VLGLGNTWTTAFILRQKIREKLQQTANFEYKYRFAAVNGNVDDGRTPADEKVHNKLTRKKITR